MNRVWLVVQALACRDRPDSLKAGLQTTTGSWKGLATAGEHFVVGLLLRIATFS
jgi:hypothetical protein